MAELRALFENGITARAIFEPLYCCLLSDSAHEALKRLEHLDFDEVGVTIEPAGPPQGYVSRAVEFPHFSGQVRTEER